MTPQLNEKALEAALAIRIKDHSTLDLLDKINREIVVDAFHIQLSREIAAYLTAAQSDGWVMVPREPTGKMSLSGFNAYQDSFGTYLTRMELAYKAMIAAAPKHPAGKSV